MLTFLGGISNCREIVALCLLKHFGFDDLYKLLGRYLDFRFTRRGNAVCSYDVSFETGLYEAMQQVYGIRLVHLRSVDEIYQAIREQRYPVIRVNSFYMPYMTVYYQKHHVYHYIIADDHDEATGKTRVFDDLLSFYDRLDGKIWEEAAQWGDLDAFVFDLQQTAKPDEAGWQDFLRQQSERLYRDYLSESTESVGGSSLLSCRDEIVDWDRLDCEKRNQRVELLLRELVSIPYLRRGFSRYAEMVHGQGRFTQEAVALANDWQVLFNTFIRQIYMDHSCIPEITDKLRRIHEQERRLVQANYDFFH
ncbi:BtrH N-terminal domain-containing protein [Brevibacillus humidisoli]|uniref:BtrH N-terminal domain-containing protein n=1 Tax=Brevibacillus humidisoli TaxID=2895522 RepID=UPI001E5622BC|nr:BtrH N-terminal domain-containing protein [Brevibacillus humidisoli]UFJ42413.1 BtrH N-terminal domain-containing protein [Brevibacillus humidisoli]